MSPPVSGPRSLVVMTVERERTADDGPYSGYAPEPERPPFAYYALLTAIFNAGFAGALLAAGRSGRLPESVAPRDVVMVGAASHRLGRLVSKNKITAFARAPFTEYQERGGPGEVEETARGTGFQRTVGELLVCPYCIGLWSSAGFHAGLIWAPRTTRMVASTFSALAISDFLHLAYKAVEERGQR